MWRSTRRMESAHMMDEEYRAQLQNAEERRQRTELDRRELEDGVAEVI